MARRRTPIVAPPPPAFVPVLGPDGKCKCDCTVYCGDDPWLAQGKSRPCEDLVVRRRDYLERMTAAKLQALVDSGDAEATRAGIVELGKWAEYGWRECIPPLWGLSLWFGVDPRTESLHTQTEPTP